MPYVRVEMIEGRSEGTKAEMARRITQAVADCAGCSPEAVFVVFEDVKAENWAIGGELVSVRKRTKESSK